MLFKQTRQEFNYNGEKGAIYRLSEDPGEQNNLISNRNLEWVKTEAYQWMREELKGVPLPLHGDDNEKHINFYKTLEPSFNRQWLSHDMPAPDSDIFPTYE